MLYRILYPLKDIFFGFNLFKYITFRAITACGCAFFLFILFYPRFLQFLKNKGLVENVKREDCEKLYQYHSHKEGVPTSGGLLVICITLITTLLFADPLNPYIILLGVAMVFFGLVGCWDDILKIKTNKKGLKKRYKLLFQSLWGLVLGVYLFCNPDYASTVEIPFFKNLILHWGIFYIVFVMVVVIATTNAVNLTDGLDGLAIGAVIVAAAAFAGMSYLVGNIKLSSYLFISYVPGSGELMVFLCALIGAGVGFLWYNSYPAEIFMGDSGSLALGGVIATTAVIIKKELLLLVIGGLFVMETISVLIQVFSFKTRGKRVFYLAPIHHHFQIKGWSEPKIIVRFWIISILFALLSLLTLKLR
ncbi:MAG: phospho-N-acetylmuramoyl-pentapeptide-transferase [Candidatus Saelkia tenebricola]|nr:phospho-N-acetylmuramoyl-pentapeptide-transferase [Candidatus Saelkia tenebricola]